VGRDQLALLRLRDGKHEELAACRVLKRMPIRTPSMSIFKKLDSLIQVFYWETRGGNGLAKTLEFG
jgi:hypothetical protein